MTEEQQHRFIAEASQRRAERIERWSSDEQIKAVMREPAQPAVTAHPLSNEARAALERDDVMGWIGSLPAAAPVGVKPLDLSNLLKHAFISGRVSMGASAASHSDAWVEYDPTESAAYKRIIAALARIKGGAK